MADPTESQFLLQEMQRRAAMTEKETQYIPPEVRDGFLVSGILVQEAKVIKVKSTSVTPKVVDKESDKVAHDKSDNHEPLPAAQAEAPTDVQEETVVKVEEKDQVEAVEKAEGQSEEDLEKVAVEGETLGAEAEREGKLDLDVGSIREGMLRHELAKETETDSSLAPC